MGLPRADVRRVHHDQALVGAVKQLVLMERCVLDTQDGATGRDFLENKAGPGGGRSTMQTESPGSVTGQGHTGNHGSERV